MIAFEVVRQPAELHLDPENPRLAGESFSVDDQEGSLRWIWRNRSVNELVDSILANGFWNHEKLFPTEEKGRWVVVEGNRRLAAVKILSDPGVREQLEIQLAEKPSEEVLHSIRELPVIHATREKLWSFVEFKHVNGPQVWDSIAKAEYVFRVRCGFGLSLAQIASGIGDRHETVARLEDRSSFGRRRMSSIPVFPPLDRAGLCPSGTTRVSIPRRWKTRTRFPTTDCGDCSTSWGWLFGSRSRNIDAAVRRQNPDLRHLARALEVQKGVDLLDSGSSLAWALDASLGDAYLFRTALTRAETGAKDVMRFVSTGFRGEEELAREETAESQRGASLRRGRNDPQNCGYTQWRVA